MTTELNIEILAKAYRAAVRRAGAFDELDELRQAVMIRDEYRRLAAEPHGPHDTRCASSSAYTEPNEGADDAP